MNYRKFSDLEWEVSEIGLGCWQIGWCWGDISDDDARKILKKALDQGINFFDTSDTYGDGRSERFLAEILKSSSDRIYVTTKLGRRIRGTNYPRGYKNEPMEEFVDRSLKNLGIECIDLLQMHCPPIDICQKDETYDLMDLLVKKGKITNYGISVYNLSEAYEAVKRPNIKSVQFVFNIFRQQPSEEFFRKARERNIALIARGPLASGLLGGDITNQTIFPENDHRNYNRNGEAFDVGDTFSGVNFEHGLLAVNELREILPPGFLLSNLALKWILMHEEITVVIPGAIDEMQVEQNAMSSNLESIAHLMPRIREIYKKYIENDVRDKWQ